MGAFCCCLRHEDFDYAPPLSGCCRRRCCRSCCSGCCLRCCCGMYAAFSHPSEEHDAASSLNSASPSQSAGLLGGTSTATSVPIIYTMPTDVRYLRPQGDVLRPEKIAANPLHVGNSETVERSNGRSGTEGLLVMQRIKGADYVEEKKCADNLGKFQQSKVLGKVESVTTVVDDEDICPTCLEGYDHENPKINTKCSHHFHLGCILEWMERSSHCPVCDKEMVFSESP